jgi:ParB family chromosome partitioning protein
MGLSALLGGEAESREGANETQQSLKRLPIEMLEPSSYQPRRHFDADELASLAESIREKGVLQPIVVRPCHGRPGYEIVAGERRWRAAQQAGVHDLPALVRELSDRDVLELALIENVQRTDLNALEEARAYRRLMQEFGYTQDELGRVIGKSRPHIANTMRLLALPEEIQELVIDGRLTAGHARALLGSEHAVLLARRIVADQLSVRATEDLVKAGDRAINRNAKPSSDPDPDVTALENRLRTHLGVVAAIRPKKSGGSLTLRYSSNEQLDHLLSRLLSSG